MKTSDFYGEFTIFVLSMFLTGIVYVLERSRTNMYTFLTGVIIKFPAMKSSCGCCRKRMLGPYFSQFVYVQGQGHMKVNVKHL